MWYTTTPHHAQEQVFHCRIIGFLQDGFEQQGVFCESLVWLRQHVGQFQPIALLVSLSPLYAISRREDYIKDLKKINK